MDEDVEMAARAGPRVIQQPRAGGLQPLDGGVEIGHFEGDMMQPFPALVDEFRDHRIRFGGLQELYTRLARGQHRYFHFFLRDSLAQAHRQAQLLFIKLQGRLERTYGDAQMINSECV